MASIKSIFIIFVSLTFFTVQILSNNCIDYFDAIDDNVKRNVACPLVTSDPKIFSKRSPYNDRKNNDDDNESKIQLVSFNCNNATEEVCNKVKESVNYVGKIISKTFILNTPILVHFNYTNICTARPNLCNIQGKRIVIGSARPAREFLMLDDDGVTRYYPQSLIKQYQLPKHPEFAPLDIIATFNSVINWHFVSSNTTIQPKQIDITYSILHEFMHGMGFKSNWNNWFLTGNPKKTPITPRPEIVANFSSAKETIFTGFKEASFDRFLIFNNDRRGLSQITLKLNEFTKSGTRYKNNTDLIQHFLDSKQDELAEFMNTVATTPKSLSSLPISRNNNNKNDGDLNQKAAILATSFVPFQNDASITHFDQSYINSTDFLMTPIQVPGKTLNDLVNRSGGVNPIGPKLQYLMECLGYETKNNPTPYRPNLVPS